MIGAGGHRKPDGVGDLATQALAPVRQQPNDLEPNRSAVSSRPPSPPWAYGLAAATIGLALFVSGTPSPLYGTYRAMWGLSPVVLTLVYATYAFGVLASLLLAGTISDHVGRRPVLLVALATLMGATILFMLAGSLVWLFAARAVQGLATGLALGAASAALLDLHPRRDAQAVGLANGVASTAGMGLGVLTSAVVVVLLPAPRIAPYGVLLLLFALAFAGAVKIPEPVAHRSRPRLTPQRPAVPSTVRPAFLLAALGVISSWSIGVSLSLGPELSAGLFHTGSPLVGALSVFSLAGPAAIAQLTFCRSAPWAGATAGSIALAAGMLAVVVAATRTGATKRPPDPPVEVHILGDHERRHERHRDPQRLRATRARLLWARAR